MKSTIKKVLMAGLVAAAAVLLSSCGYNAMQQQEEAVYRAWGDLEAQLQRRADLVPNLVATVKGYAAHESQTLDADVANGAASVTSNDLNFVNFNGDWYYQRWVGLSLGYFKAWGGNDCTIYASCSPDSDGEVFEVDYLPWENIKLMAQYTAYNKFDGISSNASDFNTLILHLNLAF